jgi:HSP20 family protein
MAIRRRNPFDELEEMFERMSEQFERGTFGDLGMGMEAMAVDLADHGDEFVVTADVPGYDKDDIKVTISDNRLKIAAERDETTKEEGEQYLRQERRHESMRRTLTLPEGVDEENITAKCRNGVLTVTLPKEHVTESGKTIDIE